MQHLQQLAAEENQRRVGSIRLWKHLRDPTTLEFTESVGVEHPINGILLNQRHNDPDTLRHPLINSSRHLLNLIVGLANRGDRYTNPNLVNNPRPPWDNAARAALQNGGFFNDIATWDPLALDDLRLHLLERDNLIYREGQPKIGYKIAYPKGFSLPPPIVLDEEAQHFTLDPAFNLQGYKSLKDCLGVLQNVFKITKNETVSFLRDVLPPIAPHTSAADLARRTEIEISILNCVIWLRLSVRLQQVLTFFCLCSDTTDQIVMNIFDTKEVFEKIFPGNAVSGRAKHMFRIIDQFPSAETQRAGLSTNSAIQDTIWYMQSIPMIVYMIQILFLLVSSFRTKSSLPPIKCLFNLQVDTRRYRSENGVNKVSFLEKPCPSIAYRFEHDYFEYDGHQTSVDMMNTIYDALLKIYYGPDWVRGVERDSDLLPLQSVQQQNAFGGFHTCDIAISGISLRFQPNNSFAPIPMVPSLELSLQAVISIIRGLQAFSIPEHLWKQWRKISYDYQTTEDGYCVLEAFIYLRHRSSHSPKPYSHMFKEITKYYKNISESVLKGSSLHTTLLFCLRMVDPDFFFNQDSFFKIELAFFDGFGKEPKLPCVSISYNVDDDNLEYILLPFKVPQDHERHDDDDVLIYYQGHIMASSYGKFKKACNDTAPTTKKAIFKSIEDGAHIAHSLKRIDWIERRISGGQAEFESMLSRGQIANPEYIKVFSSGKKIHKLSADFETGTCHRCSALYGYEAQDAFCCSLAWGVLPSENITFIGHECSQVAKESKRESYSGCVTQFLEWIKLYLGVYYKDPDTGQFSNTVIRRFIYFYNGANFDIHFIHRVLLGWGEKIDMLPMDGAIVSLEWGNITFLDFYRLFPGGSLDKCFESFRDYDVPERRLMPRGGKWKCFPYGCISDKDYLSAFTIEQLEDPELWGNKFVGNGVQSNIDWWIENIHADGYYPQLHLADYCTSDVILLQYMVMIEAKYIAVGNYGDRYFDTNDCLTASSAAMRMFQQAFLKETITSPYLDDTVPILDPITNRDLTLQRVWDMSYAGGKVDVLRHDITDPRYEEAWKRYTLETGKPHLIDEYDFNSMYPACMLGEMPIEFLSYHPMDEAMAGPVVDSNLYWASVSYRDNESGILSRCMNRCVALQNIPKQFVDPVHRDHTQFSFIWGVELNEAFDHEAQISLYGEFKMKTAPIYNDYVKTIYGERLATKNELVKNVKKLRLNGLYGKKAQARRASLRIIYNSIDTIQKSENEEIVTIKKVPGMYHGKELYAVEVLNHEDAWVGQWKFIAAFITAKARALLCRAVRYVQGQQNSIGGLCQVYYTDTDSIKCDIPKACDACKTGEGECFNADCSEFYKLWVHQNELGKLKSETKNVGYDRALFCRKKTNVCHKYGAPNMNEFVVKCKGLPKNVVTAKDMEFIYETKQSLTFVMPMSFKRHFDKGIEKTTNLTRSVGIGNSARQPPDVNGELKPWLTIEDFISAQKSCV